MDWWHAVFPNTTCNATLCANAPNNPSNGCCEKCLKTSTCGETPGTCLTNTTDFDVNYQRYATPVHDSTGRPLYGFKTMPSDKRAAYETMRDYYNGRIAWISSVGDKPYSSLARINSVTCVSHMELYVRLHRCHATECRCCS
eukprot:SAG31_NODE_3954_length_3721_cov_2.949475_6_plen_142_part_00